MSQKIDSENLDVIVIGAGPAGGSAARELAKLGRKVLLIERSQEIGQPNFSTAGTPKETIEEFGLPKKIISAEWNKIEAITPGTKTEWKYARVMGYVLDFAGLRKFLAEDAARWGSKILVGTSVTDFIKNGEFITGVKYRGVLGEGIASAKVIVDATGHSEFANTKYKINRSNEKDLGLAMEYVMTEIPKEDSRTLKFYFGTPFAPHGYAWIFPMYENKDAKIGVCTRGAKNRNEKLQDIQDKFISSISPNQKMQPIEIHAGAARLSGKLDNHVYKNIVLIGDSARQVNPLGGEGIRHALAAGRLAAGIISPLLDGSKLDEKKLKKNYEGAWRKKYGRTWKFSYIFYNVFYELNDELLDDLLSRMQDISADDFFEFLFHYDFSRLLKYPKLRQFFFKHMRKLLLYAIR